MKYLRKKKKKEIGGIPREDEICHLEPIPCRVFEEEILAGTVVDEYHDHNADSTLCEIVKGNFDMKWGLLNR